MPKLDDQIATLQTRLQQLKLRQQRVEARKRAVAADRDRKTTTRRRILVGALILDKMQSGELEAQTVMAWLDRALTRAGDRALFDLPPLATVPPEGEPPDSGEGAGA
jgi:large subunit ribosomal protein L7/L12